MPLLGRGSERDDARERAYRAWFARQHPLALASLLLSAFSLTHLGTLWVDELLGIALGAVALAQIRRARRDASGGAGAAGGPSPGRIAGAPLAWAGIVVGLVSLGCAVVVYFVL